MGAFPYAQDEDELQDGDQTPYDSVGSRGQLSNVSQGDGNPDAEIGDQQQAPPTDPRQLVSSTIAGRLGMGNPDIQKMFEADQQNVNELRNRKIQSDYIGNLVSAGQTAARGGAAPLESNLGQNISKQSQDVLNSGINEQSRRERVMGTILNANEARASREGMAKDKSQAMALAAKEKADEKEKAANEKRTTAMKDDLDPNKARGGNLAGNQKRVDNADRVQTLLDQVHNNPDPRQMEELAIASQALISSSGTPAAEQVKALIPKSAQGDWVKLKEWIMNDPMGTGQQKFVQRMAETVKREREVAVGQVKRAQRARLTAHERLKKSDPESYYGVLNGYDLGEQQEETEPNKGTGQPGGLVKVQGKLYKIGADGDSLEEVM